MEVGLIFCGSWIGSKEPSAAFFVVVDNIIFTWKV